MIALYIGLGLLALIALQRRQAPTQAPGMLPWPPQLPTVSGKHRTYIVNLYRQQYGQAFEEWFAAQGGGGAGPSGAGAGTGNGVLDDILAGVAAGSASGAGIGAGIGSAIEPGIGTGVGGAVGGVVGGVVGGSVALVSDPEYLGRVEALYGNVAEGDVEGYIDQWQDNAEWLFGGGR